MGIAAWSLLFVVEVKVGLRFFCIVGCDTIACMQRLLLIFSVLFSCLRQRHRLFVFVRLCLRGNQNKRLQVQASKYNLEQAPTEIIPD